MGSYDWGLNDWETPHVHVLELMAAFDGLGADYERRMAARDEHQKTFLQTHASYLDGLLRKHGLGDEPNNGQSSGSNAAAGKIFRKAAYVAETFRSAPLRTVL